MILIAAILIFIIIVTVLIAWIMRKKDVTISSRLKIVSAVILTIGIALIYFYSTELFERFRKNLYYQVTNGVVLSSEIVGERAFHPQVVYQYELGGTIYKDTSHLDPPMFGGKRKKYDVAHVLTDSYVMGDTIRVIYNPDDHAESYLKISMTWNLFASIGFGIVLAMLGLIGLILKRKDQLPV